MNNGKPKKFFSFSVIIPAFNEEDYIADCLKSLKEQDYPGKIEIIVVDNASTDKTSEIARESGVDVVLEEKKGPSRARNAGARRARGEILAFTDADSNVPPYWISRLNDIYNQDNEIVAAGGLFVFYGVGFIIDILANKLAMNIINLVQGYILTPWLPFLAGPNMSIRKEVFEKCGGFDVSLFFGEDVDIAKKVSKYGKLFFDPTLKIPTSFRRYSGNHINIFMILCRATKEMLNMLYRFARISLGAKSFSGQLPIREKRISNRSTIRHGNRDRKRVSLTFDDGPYGSATNQILDILKEKSVKATFFLVGKNTKRHPDIALREKNEGHLIGNHSYDHPWLLFLKGQKSLENNLEKADQAIHTATGLHPRLFRPPHGFRSPMMIRYLKNRGYDIILWDIITTDYYAGTKPEKIIKKIIKKIRPGSIITIHDGRDTKIDYPRENIIRALPDIIDGIRAKGFEIVPLDQLIGEKAYF